MNLRTAIVEDSKPDAERLKQLLKKAFENENISCSCFASGDEFLRAGWREGYQVVFLDICMEGTNGIETAQRLRAADPDLLCRPCTAGTPSSTAQLPVDAALNAHGLTLLMALL